MCATSTVISLVGDFVCVYASTDQQLESPPFVVFTAVSMDTMANPTECNATDCCDPTEILEVRLASTTTDHNANRTQPTSSSLPPPPVHHKPHYRPPPLNLVTAVVTPPALHTLSVANDCQQPRLGLGRRAFSLHSASDCVPSELRSSVVCPPMSTTTIANLSTTNLSTTNASTTDPHSCAVCPPPRLQCAVPQAPLVALRNAYGSLNSDASCASSVSSVESLLELRRENPEEILRALGFGPSGQENLDPLLRVPVRFFEQQSCAKGVHIQQVIHSRKVMHFATQRSIDKHDHCDALNRHHHRHQHHSHHLPHHQQQQHPLEVDPLCTTPLHVSVRQPKVLVMGSKSYEFDLDSNLYSPKTNNADHSPSLAASFASVHSPNFCASPPIVAANFASEHFLSVPPVRASYGGGYRKLSCPNIDFELTAANSTGPDCFQTDYLCKGRSQSGSIEQLLGTGHRHSIACGQLCGQDRSNVSTIHHSTSSIMDDPQAPLEATPLGGLGASVLTPTNLSATNNVNPSLELSSFIETALITSIQSLKLAIDFYRYFVVARSESLMVDSGFGDSRPHNHSHKVSSVEPPTNNPTLMIPVTDTQTNTTKPATTNNFENDQHLLTLQNLYLDVLEVETMLYDCLAKFKHSSNWPVFVTKYVHQLHKAEDRIAQIQESLRRLNSRSFRHFPFCADHSTLSPM